MKPLKFLMLLVVLFSSGCLLLGPDDEEPLVGGVWALLYEADTDGGNRIFLPSGQDYTLDFSADGTVLGQADCNRCPGEYFVVDGSGITITVGCTEKACGIDSRSDYFAELVTRADSFEIRGGELFLFTDDRLENEKVLVFRRDR